MSKRFLFIGGSNLHDIVTGSSRPESIRGISLCSLTSLQLSSARHTRTSTFSKSSSTFYEIIIFAAIAIYADHFKRRLLCLKFPFSENVNILSHNSLQIPKLLFHCLPAQERSLVFVLFLHGNKRKKIAILVYDTPQGKVQAQYGSDERWDGSFSVP
jgi:hypothetical protein